MRIMPIANSNYAQNRQQTNFKSKIVANETLSKAFVSAEKQACERFLNAITSLKNDGLHRTIELSGRSCYSKDGVLLTKTKLKSDDKETEMVGFPSLYSIEPEESIGNDARLLIIDLAQGYFFGQNKKEPEEVRKGLKEIRKDIFK